MSEVGVRDGAAFWKLSSDVDPHDYAVVWTPGDRWFALDVAGDYSYTYFEEDTPDDDVVKLIEKLAQGARAYMNGERSVIAPRILKAPFIRVQTSDGPVELHLSLMGSAKRVLSGPFLRKKI